MDSFFLLDTVRHISRQFQFGVFRIIGPSCFTINIVLKGCSSGSNSAAILRAASSSLRTTMLSVMKEFITPKLNKPFGLIAGI